MKRSVFFIFLSIILFSCTSKPVFESAISLPNATWNRFNSLKYTLDIEKAGEYDVFVIITYYDAYPYSNLNIDFTYYSSDGESRTRPHSLNLKNSEGVSSGEKLESGLYKYSYQTFKALSIKQSGVIAFEIDNVMPVFDLKGVHSAGIIVRKHKPDKNTNN